jgi:hypothetical protein
MGRKAATKATPEKEWNEAAKLVFCAALASGAMVGEAAAEASINRATAYNWREADADFAAAWDEALQAGTEILEAEATRRAVHGVEEPVVYQGQLTPIWERDQDGEVVYDERRYPQPSKEGEPQPDVVQKVPRQARDAQGNLRWLTVRKPSDTLMIFLLKARKPATYRERVSMEHTGKDGKDLPVAPAGVLVVPGLVADSAAWSAAVQAAKATPDKA